MDEYEQSVMRCLTANGETFVAHEYAVEGGWSYPDFVALRANKRAVYIVEVSAAGDLSNLVKKILSREEQWIDKLRAQLLHLKLTDSRWRFQILVFIQEGQVNWLRGKIGSPKDVTVLSLEEAIAHWR